ncbi:MAG: hypothetical protein AB7O97_05020 [Planctomycetota bacterium]
MTAPTDSPRVIPDIVEEHFDELDFLWELRDANLETEDWDLADLAAHEDRAEAHLDGLRLAGAHGAALARRQIGGGEPGAALASTLVLLDAGDEDAVRDALLGGDAPVVDGVRRALRHRDGALEAELVRLAAGDDALRAAAAADVLAFRRRKVAVPAALLGADDAGARAWAFAAMGRAGGLDAAALETGLADAEAAVRRAALRAAARQRTADLLPRCRAAAARPTDPDPAAIELLGAIGGAEDEAVLLQLTGRPDVAAAAVLALGALGRPSVAPPLLDLFADDALGPLAVRAYRRLTGATDVEGERPLAPPDEVADALPPDPQKARADWDRRRQQLRDGALWQLGVEIGQELPAQFDRFTLQCRADVWLRLRHAGRRAPDLELEALARRQGGR